MTDKPITEDPKALAEYLVTKALEAFDLRFGGTKSDRVFERAGFQTHVRERMNNAAQTITAEVEALRDDSLMWKDGLGHCRAALDGCVKERGAAIARAERAEAGLSRAIDVTNERDGLRLDLAAAIARAERAEGLCAEAMYALGQQGRPADLMPMAVRAVVSRADAAEVRAERAEAGLAALREASRSVVHVAVVPYSDKGNALLQAFDKVIADTAAAAEAYRARIAEETAAPWKAALDAARRELQRTLDERDTLAAALAEVREIHAALVANDALPREAWSEAADAKHADLSERLDAAMAALPADLAAERDRRLLRETRSPCCSAAIRCGRCGHDLAHYPPIAADERGGR